jgi:hypothetical protein
MLNEEVDICESYESRIASNKVSFLASTHLDTCLPARRGGY